MMKNYKYLRVWNHYTGFPSYYIRRLEEEAEMDDAPADVVYAIYNGPEKWVRYGGLSSAERARLDSWMSG